MNLMNDDVFAEDWWRRYCPDLSPNESARGIYLIGSLRNPWVPIVAEALREDGHEVFDDWYSAGPKADDYWQEHQQYKGLSYGEALKGYAARNVYEFDKTHLDRCAAAVLVMPAGRSGHMELGYMLGRGKKGYVLFDAEPERWDVMYQLANGVFFRIEELRKELLRA